MQDFELEEQAAALEHHDRELIKLSELLTQLLCPSDGCGRVAHCRPSEAANRQIVYITAQMSRHRVSIALIASRLDMPWAGQS